MKKFTILIACILFGFIYGCDQNNSENNSESDSSDKNIRWKMAATFPGSLTQIGTLGVRFQNQINLVSTKYLFSNKLN